MGWWVVNSTPWPLYSWEGDPVPTGREAGWAPGPVCIGAENFTASRIHFPEHPALYMSQYRLCCPDTYNK